MTSPSEQVGTTRAGEDGALDPNVARDVIEYCYSQGWTDGLPVVPCTERLLVEFLATVDRGPSDVVLAMPQLNRRLTVSDAAVNAAMAGCLPEYFPVVLAAWDSLRDEGYVAKGIWQSTTGCGTLLVVNGPVRGRLGLNSAGNVFGPGFRANATIGRAVRLAAITTFGLQPHVLDQATQGTPAKYTSCLGENEEESPWAPLHHDLGLGPEDSAVTAMMMRSSLHVEARHTVVPEQLLRDVADSVARTGALLHETISCCVVLSPEHAHLLARAGWEKRDVRSYVYDRAVRTREALDRVGKGAVSRDTRWRVPSDHPDAVRDEAPEGDERSVRVLNSPEAVLVVVAGASNSGVSAVVETFGPRGGPPSTARVVERGPGTSADAGTGVLAAAFADVASTLGRDGYLARWHVDRPRTVRFRVVASESACPDCLVPKPVMKTILEHALEGTGYAIHRIEYPADA